MVKRVATVEVGRVVSINYGPLAGKAAVIVDIVDQARALIDGPSALTGVRRQTIPIRNLSLTPLTVPIARGVREGTLQRKVEESKVLEAWQSSNWARKSSRHQQRRRLTDFQRFELMLLRKRRSRTVGVEFAKLRREAAASSGSSKASSKSSKGGKSK